MKYGYLLGAAIMTMAAQPAWAADAAEGEASASAERMAIIVTGARQTNLAGTKTDTPVLQTPQPVTVVTDEVYLAQGAVSISDTLRYVAGVQANPYGSDTRVDNALIRGINPAQFRDGMHDMFSYYASIRSDPYNFSRVEVVRGPASVLFGSGSIGGLVNMVSKVPEFDTRGEVSLRYGSFDRKEALADLTGPLADGLAGRIVARVRDAGTQTDHVPDDRVMIAPSLRWQPSPDTDVVLLGLYQEDDGGSTAQFLPNVGTILPNPNGKLANSLFIGKPGWDRYDGRLLQGTGTITHRFNDKVRLSVKARYVDSDLTYLTHYPNSYSNPSKPYVDAAQRTIGLYADGSIARMEIFTTDNNLQVDFNTGGQIEHKLLAGIDFSWNRVRKVGGLGYEFIDIYAPNYAALSDYGGGIPSASDPNFLFSSAEDTAQKQLGVYLQDQIRLYDRASIVLGVRRDHVSTRDSAGAVIKDNATTFRAGVIVEMAPGISPFFSYTQSFEPISGTTSNGDPFKPKRGRQFEGGVKLHPDERTLVTATAFHIRERNRPVDDPSTADPFDQRQAGGLTSKGFEIEASRMLPDNFEVIANYSYTWIREDGTAQQLDTVARHNASFWTTKTVRIGEAASLRLGSGLRYSGAHLSGAIRTPGYAVVDALIELARGPWSVSVNANNLLGKDYYAACLGRGDCFIGAARNVFGTVSYRF